MYVGFTSSQTEHGGQESTLLSLYQAIMHWGGILVTPGYTDPIKFQDGNPYGVSHVTGADNDAPLEDVRSRGTRSTWPSAPYEWRRELAA